MAQDTKENEEPTEDDGTPKKRKKGPLVVGGIVALVASAYVLSLAAVPKMPMDMPMKGPFVVQLSQATPNVQANLKGDGGKRFVSMSIKAEYHAYSEDYATDRTAEPLYQAKERDAILLLTRSKTKEDLLEQVGVDIYKRELRDILSPLLFPVHVGNENDPATPDETSGIAPGSSIDQATMRGGFKTNTITIDVPKGTMQLDSGPVTQFDGSETNLQLTDEAGRFVFVKTTEFKPDFQGKVHVGTFGAVDEVLFDQFIIQ